MTQAATVPFVLAVESLPPGHALKGGRNRPEEVLLGCPEGGLLVHMDAARAAEP